MGQMAAWSKWFLASSIKRLLCRKWAIKPYPSQVLWSLYSASTHAEKCVSNLCICTIFHRPNKPLGRLPTPEVHRVNMSVLKLYMDTRGHHILSKKHTLPTWGFNELLQQSLIFRCTFSTATTCSYVTRRERMKKSGRQKDWHLHFINLTDALILSNLIGVQQ